MATLIALTLVHSGNRTERRLYADDAIGRRRSAHHAMQAAIGGSGVVRTRGELASGGMAFKSVEDAVYIPASAHQAGN